jgi:hypothetical protein
VDVRRKQKKNKKEKQMKFKDYVNKKMDDYLGESKRDDIIANIDQKQKVWDKAEPKVIKIFNSIKNDIKRGKLNDKKALSDIEWVLGVMKDTDTAFFEGFSDEMSAKQNLAQFKMWADPDIITYQKMKRSDPQYDEIRKMLSKKYPGQLK